MARDHVNVAEVSLEHLLVAFGEAKRRRSRFSLAQAAAPPKRSLLVKRGPNSACSLTNLPIKTPSELLSGAPYPLISATSLINTD